MPETPLSESSQEAPLSFDEDALDGLVGEYSGVGTWVREEYDATDEWHRSVEYDGEIHYLGCGYAIAAQTRVAEVDLDISDKPAGDICEGCGRFYYAEGDDD